MEMNQQTHQPFSDFIFENVTKIHMRPMKSTDHKTDIEKSEMTQN